MLFRVSLCLTCAVLFALPSVASAFHGNATVSTSALRPVTRRNLSATTPNAGWQRFRRLEGGTWHAVMDATTGVALQIYGAGIAAPGAIVSAARAQAHARNVMARHLAWLAPGSVDADFIVAANRELRGVRSVTFQQQVRGVPIVGAYMHFAFKKDRLVLLGSRALPHVRMPPGRPTLGATIFPLRGPTGKFSFHLVRTTTVGSAKPFGRWLVFTDVATNREVARRSLVFSATGQVRFNVPDRHPGASRSDYAAVWANTTVDGASQVCDGSGNVSWTGAATAAVTTTATGSFVIVENLAGAGATSTFSLNDAGSITWSAAADELSDAQLSAYIHTNAAKRAARQLNPGLAWVDQTMVAQVNADGECNAFSLGDGIYFLRGGMHEGQVCQNPARVADIVLHEVGHSVHVQSIIPGMGDSNAALAEGLADYFATTILNDPALGEGFIGVGPLRHLDPVGSEAVWPDDIDTDTHLTGLIIGGALWDLRKALIADMGASAGRALADRLFYSVVQRAADIPSSYAAVLLEDDDDGDLANGTPNQCTIDAVFFAHGLGGAAGASGALVSTNGLTVALSVPAAQPGCPTVSAAELVWRVRGDSASMAIAMTEVGGEWQAQLPSQVDDTVMQYQVRVTTTNTDVFAFPRNVADAWYELYVGTPVEIYCTDFETDVLNADWTTTATRGVNNWQWGPPMGLSTDPSRAYSGARILGNTLSGTGAYDSDSTNRVVSPLVDVTGYDVVRLQYRRWLNVEDAFWDKATIFVNDVEVWQNVGGPDAPHHLDSEWRFHDIDLTALAGGNAIQVAFELRSDTEVEYGGWNLDDVCIVGYNVAVAIDAGVSTDASFGPDAGGGEGGEGCGCNSGNPTPARTVLFLLCTLVLCRRRRRLS